MKKNFFEINSPNFFSLSEAGDEYDVSGYIHIPAITAFLDEEVNGRAVTEITLTSGQSYFFNGTTTKFFDGFIA
jgi:hypothetical protein